MAAQKGKAPAQACSDDDAAAANLQNIQSRGEKQLDLLRALKIQELSEEYQRLHGASSQICLHASGDMHISAVYLAVPFSGPKWRLPGAKLPDEEKRGEQQSLCEALLVEAMDGSGHADLQFEIDDTVVASGHKCVLCSKSAVFAKMFSVEMREKQTNTIQMHDVSAGALRIFLQAVYLGKIPIPCVLVFYV
jgi:hypothetical protein